MDEFEFMDEFEPTWIGEPLLHSVHELSAVAAAPLGCSRSSCDDCMTRSLCIFAKLGSQPLRQLQPWVRQRNVKKGDVLAKDGEVSQAVQVMKVGIGFGQRRGLDGDLWPIAIAGRGAVFGLAGLFGKPNEVAGVAISAGRVCEIPVSALKDLTARQPQTIEHFAERAVAASGLIASWSAGMRIIGVCKQLSYAVLLLADSQQASVVELPNQSELARLLGTSRETVARAMAVLEGSGSLRHIERKKFEVSRPGLMARLAPTARAARRQDS